MKRKFLILFFALLPTLMFAQEGLEKTKLLDNKIEMLVPKSFHVMTEAEYKIKYPNPKRKVSLILTDKDLEVNLVIDHLKQYDLADDQIEDFKNAQLTAIQKSHPEGKVIENGVKEVNGKKVGYFKIITQASDQKIFNYFIFTNLEEKVLLMTFNCIEKLKPTWEKSIDEMIASFKIIK